MKQFISLRDRGIQGIRQCSHLVGKSPLARGTFCLVFEGQSPNSVFKLTVEKGQYLYLTSPRSPGDTHKPQVFRDFKQVGRLASGHPVFMVEMERLAELPKGTPQRTLFRRAIQEVFTMRQQQKPIRQSRIIATIPESYILYSQSAFNFIQEHALLLNSLQGRGLMQRPDSEQIVVSDLAIHPSSFSFFPGDNS